MALPEEPLSIVEQWKKKIIEMSFESNDSVVSLLTKSIDTMAVVLNKKSDLDNIQRALMFLDSERSLSFQFDKNKNDGVRALVYGQIECLHFTLRELTKDRNQVKECGEMFTQTDQVTDQTPILFEYPKEELFDESSIKIEDLWDNDLEIKDEEMPNDNVEINIANEDMDGYRVDGSNIVHNDDNAQSEMPAMDYMGDESQIENEDISKKNENIGDNREEDREKNSSETVDVENKRRSTRKVSRPVSFADNESLDNSDEDSQPSMSEMKAESSKRKNKTTSDAFKKRGRTFSSKGQSREMKCTECKFQTTYPASFTYHLRYVHFTTLRLAGLALCCDCGVEVLSHLHKCDIANFTVVRKRDGPIQTINKEKTTPQCILCDEYPTTADGYVKHLSRHHKSTLSSHGVWLLCECGAKYRHTHPHSKHTKECTRREFTLHKYSDN